MTDIGKQMSAFPLDPAYSRMLIASVDLRCSEEMLSLISMLSVEHLFYRPSSKKSQDYAEEKRKDLFHRADEISSSALPGNKKSSPL